MTYFAVKVILRVVFVLATRLVLASRNPSIGVTTKTC